MQTISKKDVLENVDFKELAKEYKTGEDLSKLTKQFMKKMIESMLEAELEEHTQNSGVSKNGAYDAPFGHPTRFISDTKKENIFYDVILP